MNKKEFIIEAALRMVGNYQGVTMEDIAGMARDLADELYPEAPIHNGKPDTDSIEVLLKEVERLERERVNQDNKEMQERFNDNWNRYQMSGFATRLHKVFESEDIHTVGDLLQRGRREFIKMRNIGRLCVETVDQALVNLYNTTTW